MALLPRITSWPFPPPQSRLGGPPCPPIPPRSPVLPGSHCVTAHSRQSLHTPPEPTCLLIPVATVFQVVPGAQWVSEKHLLSGQMVTTEQKRGAVGISWVLPPGHGSQTLSGVQLGLGENRSGFKGCEADDTVRHHPDGGRWAGGSNKVGWCRAGPWLTFQGSQARRPVRAGAQSWPCSSGRLPSLRLGARERARGEEKGQRQRLPRSP